MGVGTEPNRKLAEEIVAALLAKELIVDTTTGGIITSLADGKMKELFWKAAFERKIDLNPQADEA